MQLNIYRVRPDADLPKYSTAGSACFDLSACLKGVEKVEGYTAFNKPLVLGVTPTHGIWIKPGDRVKIPTGLVLDIPEFFSVRIHPRSSVAYKKGITLCNAEAVIDSDYVDEVFLLIENTSMTSVEIKHGDRLAQAEVVPVALIPLAEGVGDPPKQKTDRIGGIGSTGE